jgi:hypothetical protein
LLGALGKRAYRRPLSPDEANRYDQLFAAARAPGDFTSAAGLVITAMLQSPYFLYRIELGRAGVPPDPDGAVPLSPYETAARLSFFLWNSMPDDALLALADGDHLGTPDEIQRVARAMIADAKARDALADFHAQWLELEGLAATDKTDAAFTPDLKAAMSEEVAAFVDDVIRRGDGRLETLLTTQHSFLRGPLYDVYGLSAPSGSAANELARVDLPVAQHRAGILTLPAVMATHAHADQTSLVHRGELVRERLLCQAIPPPPPNVDVSLPAVDPNVTARVRFERHRQNPACAACHDLMDPLGTPFEEFDAIGRYRAEDGRLPVDSTGEITGTTGADGPVTQAAELAAKLATAREVRDCVAKQWFRYAFQRIETNDDQGTLNAAATAFRGSDYAIPELLVALTTTRGFRYRKADP